MTEHVLEQWRLRIATHIDKILPSPQQPPTRLHAAMRYATLSQGKRIRPLLVYAAGYLFRVDDTLLDPAAAAIELIHCYSLIHDDLPAMDNDILRRGKPTAHIAFDEATAILAGDALLTLAFEQLTCHSIETPLICKWLQTLTTASGSLGMCGGQAMDLEATAQHCSQSELETIHALKTGALIRASVRMGALAAACSSDELAQLDRFATQLGLAFQVRDDILDVASTAEQLGKTPGKDAKMAKSTFVALLGLEGAQSYLRHIADSLKTHLETFEAARCGPLRAIARLAILRTH